MKVSHPASRGEVKASQLRHTNMVNGHQLLTVSAPQYLPLPEFDDVTNALNFETADCHVLGGCDLYTIKAASGDKKLYKAIEQSLESQYASLLSFSAGLSASQAASAAGSLNLSRASPFGSLSHSQSRRTYAYLIATLNASHPDYDFSHLLRPSDFRRERSLKRVINTLDTTLYNLRPRPTGNFGSAPQWSANSSSSAPLPSPGNEMWSPRMWRLIDKEMDLKNCYIYCYIPEEDPYDGEEGFIWSFNYFFFNKDLKRVCYIYLRGLSAINHNAGQKTPVKRGAERELSLEESTSSKRARFWLGDHALNATSAWTEDEDEFEGQGSDSPHDSSLVHSKEQAIVINDEQNASSPNDTTSSSIFETTSPESIRRSQSRSTIRGVSQDIHLCA